MRRKNRCKECGAPGQHVCARCENWRCWLHLKARKTPRGADLFYLVCRGNCRLRARSCCKAVSPTTQQCQLTTGHDGPHALAGGWMWFDGGDDYLERGP